ncbi:hypothetical protein CVD28_01950 [Bacillus sp. M6-12]|uniref:hypothetical protein n=1 Tax=Bacillus sp. M6-12 TaxID=2054166 RepID=UPI000C793030|nr:hypothetical protein [Bacillus sp. M6-12]PLS19195.1 hypothetical protein CVD28_01950 [Bacillus sp. M6-12]
MFLKDTQYVLETAQNTFIQMDVTGEKTLLVYETNEYIYGQIFDSEKEVNDYIELFNTGKSSNPHLAKGWNIIIEQYLLPVRRRTLITELL